MSNRGAAASASASSAATASSLTGLLFPDNKNQFGAVVPPVDEPLPKNASSLVVGIDGDYFVEQLLTRVHDCGDKYWMFTEGFPSSITRHIDLALDQLARTFQRIVIVFDGIPTKLVDRTACCAPNVLKQNVAWRTLLDPRNSLHKQLEAAATPELKAVLTSCTDGAFPDPQGLAYIKRYIMNKRKVEVFTAPSIAWAQLACFLLPVSNPLNPKQAPKADIDVIIGPGEVLLFAPVERVFLNIDWDKGTCKSKCVDRSGSEAVEVASIAPIIGRHPRQVRRFGGFVNTQQHSGRPIATWIPDAPVFSLDTMEVKQLSRVREPGCQLAANTRDFYQGHLGGSLPKTYYAMAFGAIDPSCLAVMASGVFQDALTILPTADYDAMMQRIMPLRAQIIYQLIQAVTQTGFRNVWSLNWERTTPATQPATQPVPICQPPEITLDEWALPDSVDSPNGRMSNAVALPMPGLAYGTVASPPPHTLTSVVQEFAGYASEASATPAYNSAGKILAATLLKSLDLLGYFTHSAGSTTQETSTGSIYASALSSMSMFPEEGVLFIELCRTRTLTEMPPMARDVSGMPGLNDAAAVYLALRILSLVNVAPGSASTGGDTSAGYQGSVNPFLIAYVSQVRCFQQNLRHLTEVVLHNLLVTPGRVNFDKFSAASIKDVAANLPFGRPLSCIAANIAITALHYGMLPQGRKPPKDQLLQHLSVTMPGVDVIAVLKAMQLFWSAAISAIEVLGQETDIVFSSLDAAKSMVSTVMRELLS